MAEWGMIHGVVNIYCFFFHFLPWADILGFKYTSHGCCYNPMGVVTAPLDPPCRVGTPVPFRWSWTDRIGTDCSGMETPVLALRALGVQHEHVFLGLDILFWNTHAHTMYALYILYLWQCIIYIYICSCSKRIYSENMIDNYLYIDIFVYIIVYIHICIYTNKLVFNIYHFLFFNMSTVYIKCIFVGNALFMYECIYPYASIYIYYSGVRQLKFVLDTVSKTTIL